MMTVEQKQRPKLVVPAKRLERGLNGITLIILIGSIVYWCMQWTHLPSRLPIHFNAKGEADRWGSRWILLTIPAFSLLLYIGLAKLSRYPHLYNYPVEITEQNAESQYVMARQLICWIKLEVVMMFGYFEWSTIRVAQDPSSGMGTWLLPIIFFVLFGTIAIYFIRALKGK